MNGLKTPPSKKFSLLRENVYQHSNFSLIIRDSKEEKKFFDLISKSKIFIVTIY